MKNFQAKANFIWQVADDILRGSFKRHEYGDVTLPFVVLRRLDCVLEETKDDVLGAHERFSGVLDDPSDAIYQATGGLNFFNTSKYSLVRISDDDPGSVALNFEDYINGFSENVQDILKSFQLRSTADKLEREDILYMLVSKFTEVDLHPDAVTNHEMGYIFEELLRRFSEMSNEAAGEHYTPREVIQLMVNLLFREHQDELEGKGIIRRVFDPACGTGGMLTTAAEHITSINPNIDVRMYGQELNDQTYAIAKSDFLVTGENPENIRKGSSFSEDQFKGESFDYMLSNPPFGVSWRKEKDFIRKEEGNPQGRFHAGTPRVSDGSLLFLQHMISKMEPQGSRVAVIFNASPLFTGNAGSGESDIRKWIIESDMLEAIVALPEELFYNTGISTYIWIVTSDKPERRKGKVQLVDAEDLYQKMPKSLGNKRNYISDMQIEEITGLYTRFEDGEKSRVFDNEDFGFHRVRIERPLRENGKIIRKRNGEPKHDTDLREYERVPLKDDIQAYFEREVKPHVTDAWIDEGYDRTGYEINFNQYFYEHEELRPVEEIKRDILELEEETEGMLKEVLSL